MITISVEPSGVGTWFRVVRCLATRRILSVTEYTTVQEASNG